jgi:hypothetical protein
MLLDVWCALNSDFGGPLLAIITIGGGLALGNALMSFPAKAGKAGGSVGDRQKFDRFRTRVLRLGWVTGLVILINVVLYVVAFGAVREAGEACPTKDIDDAQAFKLLLFYGCSILTCFLGAAFAWFLNKLQTK